MSFSNCFHQFCIGIIIETFVAFNIHNRRKDWKNKVFYSKESVWQKVLVFVEEKIQENDTFIDENVRILWFCEKIKQKSACFRGEVIFSIFLWKKYSKNCQFQWFSGGGFPRICMTLFSTKRTVNLLRTRISFSFFLLRLWVFAAVVFLPIRL